METMYLYTDATVRGEWIIDPRGEPARTCEGMAGGAWIGWIGYDTDRCPDVAGMEYLGPHTGPQEAEMLAAYHGMRSSLRFTETVECSMEDIVVHTDNRWVAGILSGRYEAHKLRDIRTLVRQVQGEFEYVGVSVHYEWVSRESPQLKVAHGMSQKTFQHTLPSPSWRPEGKRAFIASRRQRSVPVQLGFTPRSMPASPPHRPSSVRASATPARTRPR